MAAVYYNHRLWGKTSFNLGGLENGRAHPKKGGLDASGLKRGVGGARLDLSCYIFTVHEFLSFVPCMSSYNFLSQ